MSTYEKVARIIRYLDQHRQEQPDLHALAAAMGYSPFHLQRLFSQWAGISPKRFLQCLTLAHAKQCLRRGESVLEAALDSGLSGPGRLHDLCVSLEAASPGELKTRGCGWTLAAGFADSPFGACLLAESPRGICHFRFLEPASEDGAWNELREAWPGAHLERNDARAGLLSQSIFLRRSKPGKGTGLRAFVRGTPFQVLVWRALLRVPSGALTSYGRLAGLVGSPGGARAVGSAVGANPLAWLIPCHRVIRESGVLGDYRWGRERKRAMIAWESAAVPVSGTAEFPL